MPDWIAQKLWFLASSIGAVLLCTSASAQVRQPKPCMPFGSFQDELRARGIGVPQPDAPRAKLRIAKVGFRGVTQLPDSDLKKIVATLKGYEVEDDERLTAVIGDMVRGFWQDRGYFRVQIKVDAQEYGKPADRGVAVGISVEEGQRYSLGEIRFLNEDGTPLHFSEAELRALIPLRDGDIFHVDRIRDGLDSLKRLYASHGYIDFTASPQTEMDDTTEISLTLRLHPGKRFRISKIAVVGLPPETLGKLKWRIKEGDVFRLNDYVAIFTDNRNLLPKGASESNVEILRDLRAGTVTLTFVFTRCEPYPY